MRLKSLEAWNKERMAEINEETLARPNGIYCPSCAIFDRVVELLDSEPNTMLTTDPPQQRIHCPECGYEGLRVA